MQGKSGGEEEGLRDGKDPLGKGPEGFILKAGRTDGHERVESRDNLMFIWKYHSGCSAWNQLQE